MTAEIFAAITGATISALVALTALWVTHIQSSRHHAESYKLSQYIAVTQRVFEVDMLFIRNPALRPYFYESEIVTVDCNIQQITAIAEYILDFYSTLQEHERLLVSQNIPSWEEWRSFIKDGFHDAPFLCDYYEQNSSWYEEGLMQIYRPVGHERRELISRQRAAIAENNK
jgi:hypothetical protein